MKHLKIIYEKIHEEDKILWKGAHCELHSAYNEFVIWIDMFSKKDLKKCRHFILDLYKEHQNKLGDLNICTWLYAKKDEDTYMVYSFEKTKELLSGVNDFGIVDEDNFTEMENEDVFIFS